MRRSVILETVFLVLWHRLSRLKMVFKGSRLPRRKGGLDRPITHRHRSKGAKRRYRNATCHGGETGMPSRPPSGIHHPKFGFTLIELLVVISIIGILVPYCAGGSSGPRGRTANAVLQQPEANRPGHAELRTAEPTCSRRCASTYGERHRAAQSPSRPFRSPGLTRDTRDSACFVSCCRTSKWGLFTRDRGRNVYGPGMGWPQRHRAGTFNKVISAYRCPDEPSPSAEHGHGRRLAITGRRTIGPPATTGRTIWSSAIRPRRPPKAPR